MKFEYTVKFNGRRYLPGVDVPMEEPKTETEQVTEEVTVAEPVKEEPIEDKVVEPKSKGRKKKSS